MDFVDWCGLVLSKLIEVIQSQSPPRASAYDAALASGIWGEVRIANYEFWRSTQFVGMKSAMRELIRANLVEELGQLYKVTPAGHKYAQDPTPLRQEIGQLKLKREEQQLLYTVNKLTQHTADDHAWIESTSHEAILPTLNWSIGQLLETTNSLEKAELVYAEKGMGPRLSLWATYRSLVWEKLQTVDTNVKQYNNIKSGDKLMWMQISAQDVYGNNRTIYYSETPGECPQCHVHNTPQLKTSALSSADPLVEHSEQVPNDSPLQMVFQCTNRKCARLFIATYHHRIAQSPSPQLPSGEYWEIVDAAPKIPLHETFGAEIQRVSPLFIEIYNQAIDAESMRLTHIAGMGFRKALEFLIKDFAIKRNPSDDETIKKKPLAQCIKDHVDDVKVKQTAKLATWLGNDETHYVRKWIGKDINDLKILIRLTVNWIESTELTEQYIASMKPSGSTQTTSKKATP